MKFLIKYVLDLPQNPKIVRMLPPASPPYYRECTTEKGIIFLTGAEDHSGNAAYSIDMIETLDIHSYLSAECKP